MLNILSDLIASKQMASIYTDEETSGHFYYGTVIAANEEETAIQMVSSDGAYDGILALKTAQVIRVETGGQYAEKLRKLCSLHPAEPLCSLPSENIMRSLLQLAEKSRKIVSIELLDSGNDDLTGFAKKVDNDQCVIHVIDDYGCDDGLSYIFIKDITQITYAAKYEERVLALWNFDRQK